jgi:hypothetical protein
MDKAAPFNCGHPTVTSRHVTRPRDDQKQGNPTHQTRNSEPMTNTGTPRPSPRWWSARCPTCGIEAAHDAVCADCGTSFDIIDNGHHVSTSPKPTKPTAVEAAP